MARVLLLLLRGYVSRAALITLVATLLLGHSLPTLCGVWCVEGPRSAPACTHDEAAAAFKLGSDEDCRSAAPAVISPPFRGAYGSDTSAGQPVDVTPVLNRASAQPAATFAPPPNLPIRLRTTALRI